MSSRSSDLSLPQGILKEKDVSELEKLQEDDAHFVEFFSALELDSMTKVKAERTAVVERVRRLALETSNLKPDYESKKSHLVEVSLQGLELKQQYDQQYDKLKKLIGNSDQAAILKDLQDSVKVSEQQAEDCIEDFLAGKTEQCIEDLIQSYLHQRTVYWLRKVKSEKLMELNRQPEPPASRPYPPPSASQPSGPPPYPSGPSSSAKPTPYGSYPPQPAAQSGYPGNPAQSMPTQPRYTAPVQSLPPQPRYPTQAQSLPSAQPGYPAPGQSIPSTRPGYPGQSIPSQPAYPRPYPNRPAYPQQQQPAHSLQGMAGGYGYPYPGQYPAGQQRPQYPQQRPQYPTQTPQYPTQTPQYPAYQYQHKR